MIFQQPRYECNMYKHYDNRDVIYPNKIPFIVVISKPSGKQLWSQPVNQRYRQKEDPQ